MSRKRFIKDGINYKVNAFKPYKVYCNKVGDKEYYQVLVEKKDYLGNKERYYRRLKFVCAKKPKDGQVIKIIRGFEDFYVNENFDKYNPISIIVVQDWENVEDKDFNQKEAFEKFQNNLNEAPKIDISIPDLPF